MSVSVTFLNQGGVECETPRKLLNFAARGPLQTLIFTLIIILGLLPTNTSFNTFDARNDQAHDKAEVISHTFEYKKVWCNTEDPTLQDKETCW